ncbi:NADH-quinone oxidoreductase subunit C [Candidatus Chlorohelix allophototropha]|uniref:NADH-quinone oxidoreductase subunit C n=2 Tax=Candidatus Chlorohelix allophototropha TaxID=3003348 RepID=A0ABY9B1S0_9CHLR|nr:NADH-quinone oxidoreductase subunit C [Chloroflexota bacterium L227-S17]
MTPTSDEPANPVQNEENTLKAERFPNVKRSEMRAADGTPTFIVPADELLEVLQYLRDEARFTMLEDVTAVDWKKEPRFQLVYNLLSLERASVIRIKVNLPGENPIVSSVTALFPGANWYEREVFDLFGITFTEHPDLRRIEMPDDWQGHPLRKDYPITGPRRPVMPANQFRPVGRSNS